MPQQPGQGPEGAAVVEPAPEAVARLEAQLAEVQDRYLRLAAEFGNYKKRMSRERTETWGKAQAEGVQRLVDALDDLARFVPVDPATTGAKTVHDGGGLVGRQIWKAVEALG